MPDVTAGELMAFMEPEGDDVAIVTPLSLSDDIDFAIECIGSLWRQVEVLESARASTPGQQIHTLQLSRIHRLVVENSMESVASPTRHAALEAIGSGNLVMALEAESDKTKSLIEKIISAIIEAFKKLWEMLTGLLKSLTGSKDAEASASALMDALEAAIKGSPELPQGSVLKSAQHRSAVAYLGTRVTMDVLVKTAREHTEYAAMLQGALDAVVKHIGELKTLAGNFKVDENVDTALKALMDFNSKAMGDLTTQLKSPVDKAALSRYGMIPEDFSPDKGSIAVMGPVMSSSGPGALIVVYEGENTFKAAYKTKQVEDKKDAEITLPSMLSGMAEYTKAVADLQRAVGKLNDDVKNKSGEFQSAANGIESAMASLKSLNDRAESNNARESIQAFLKVAKAMGSIEAALVNATQGLSRATGIMTDIVYATIKLANGKSNKQE